MKFEFNHTFDVDVDRLIEVMFDDALPTFLVERMPSLQKMEPLEKKDGPDFIERQVRYVPVPMIQKIGPKKVPPEAMIWVEKSRFDKARKEMTFDNEPTHPKVRKLMTNRGVMKLTSLGTGQCRRTMTGELLVNVPILGRIAEKIIFKNASKIIEEEVLALQAFLKSKQ